MWYIKPLQRPCNRFLGVELLLWHVKLMFIRILIHTLKLLFKMVVLPHEKVPRSPASPAPFQWLSVSGGPRSPHCRRPEPRWHESAHAWAWWQPVCFPAVCSGRGALHGESGARKLSVRLASDLFFLISSLFSFFTTQTSHTLSLRTIGLLSGFITLPPPPFESEDCTSRWLPSTRLGDTSAGDTCNIWQAMAWAPRSVGLCVLFCLLRSFPSFPT